MIIALLTTCLLLRNSVIHIKKRCGGKEQARNSDSIGGGNKETEKPLATKTRVDKFLGVSQRFTLQDLADMSSKKAVSDMSSSSNDESEANDSGKTILSFPDSEEAACLEICGDNVRVIGRAGKHTHGSSKVKLKTVVDYKWETKHYPGHLIAVQFDGDFMAYVIVNNKANRMEGMVRVMHLPTSARCLIKGMSGEILDLQFGFIWTYALLAIIDASSLYVHRIVENKGTLESSLYLQIDDPIKNYTPTYDKICWCNFLPRDDDYQDDDENHLIIWARGSKFQIFQINTILTEHEKRKITADEIKEGYVSFADDSTEITYVTFSPDGTTVCICSKDGCIRFYQVYMFEKNWRCLHLWQPHNGKPISCCFFLDNLSLHFPSSEYWKYAITGADNNTELKLWDCGNWTCLQTITLSMENDSFNKNLRFLAEMDPTAQYMVLSNLETKSCYVMQIDNVEIKNGNDRNVRIKSIAEFPLNSGILSFAIRDSSVRRYKCGNDSFLCEELYDYDEENNSVICVVVRLLLVQSKSVQECSILYQPTVFESTQVRSSISANSSAGFQDKIDSSSKSSFNDTAETTDEPSSTNDDNKNDLTKALNPLQVLFGMSSSTAGSSANKLNDTTDAAHNSSSSKIPPNSVESLKTPGSTPHTNSDISDSRNVSPKATTPGSVSNPANAKNFNQVSLMTPDSFTAKSTPESGVSTDVLNTILMLANATKQQQQQQQQHQQQQPQTGSNTAPPSTKPDNNLLDMLNNKLKENQEQKKVHVGDPVDPQKKFVAIDHNPICDNTTSGGSSPSREVQEIMSQEFDKSSTSGCEDEDVIGEPEFKPADDVLDVKVDQSSKSPSSGKGASAVIFNSWEDYDDELTAKITQATWDEMTSQKPTPSSAKTNHSANKPEPPPPPSTTKLVNGNDENLDMANKMGQLLDMMKLQTLQINSLKNEIEDLKKTNAAAAAVAPQTQNNILSEYLFKMEFQLTKTMDQCFKRMELEQTQRLHSALSTRESQSNEMRDDFMQCFEQFLNQKMTALVESVVKNELQKNTVPIINAKIDQVYEQIQKDMSQKINRFDTILKENIAQACKNKSVIDAFGKSVLFGVENSLQSAFIESMSTTLIPAYEKSSQNMFQQLHKAFSLGMKEFMDQFQNYSQQIRASRSENNEEIITVLTSIQLNIDALVGIQRSTFNDALLEIRKDIQSLEVLLSRSIQEILRTEIRKGFDSQVAVLRSNAATPAPLFDAKETIKLYLSQGQINKAFHQALLANDLNLVEFTLKTADHSAVFMPECALEQKVLLSLLQQISADMSNHNELKQSYLADALLAINLSDPIAREHGPKIINEVFRSCQMFLIQHPKNPQCSNVRMLLKAIQSTNKENV